MPLIRSAARSLVIVLLAAAWVPVTRAAFARVLEVRPVAPAEAILAAQRKGLPTRAAPLTAAEREILTQRLARQRAFLPLQKRLFDSAPNVDRSMRASRRLGWRPSDARLRAPGALSARALAPPDTTIHMAILRVDFLTDRGGAKSSGNGRFDLDPADSVDDPVDRPPHDRAFYQAHGEALSRYYDAMSFGHVHIVCDVWPSDPDSAYHLTDMADFGPWTFGSSIFGAAVKMFRTMFFAADSQSIAKGDPIPWQNYDRFTIIHAGSDLQSDVRQDSPEDIPSFTLFLSDTDRVIFPDSAAWNLARPIDRASFIPETINQDGYYGAINGVIAHENGHNCFGFGDVYDIESGFPVVGYWSLMDSGNLVGSRVELPSGEIFAVGLLPPSVDPFQRNFVGDSMRISVPTFGDTIALRDNERVNQFYKLPLSSDEYLLLENRYLAPAPAVHLDQDSVTHVVLGPKDPDRFEYDALLPGGGILVWHVDESVIPFETSLRVNPDFGFNTNPGRLGLDVVEADGLDDLGDPGSPFILGSPLDPYQKFVNPTLSDTTLPNLVPNTGTLPHARLDFLDNADSTMRFVARRAWQLPGFPVKADFAPGGPVLLAIDADGDRKPDACWAGGDTASADSAALFAVRFDAKGVDGADTLDFAHLDQRPRPELAALVTGDPSLGYGPSLFAATTYHYGAADAVGGKLWLVDDHGVAQPGFPVALPSPASTPPIIAGVFPNFLLIVGCEDGRVRVVNPQGQVLATADAMSAAVSGRLALWTPPGVSVGGWIAAGSAAGEVQVTSLGALLGLVPLAPGALPSAVRTLGTAGFTPDFLWLRLGGAGANAASPCASDPTLIVHDVNRLWALCPATLDVLPGWGHAFPDTLVSGLGAGDPDGDGFPEVLVQTVHSGLAFVNASGYPSPGWPKPGSTETLHSSVAPLSMDLNGDGRSEVVALNGSGIVAALDAAGHEPAGFPLATGAGAGGGMIATDLDLNGSLEIVAPDRFDQIYAYTLPAVPVSPTADAWAMTGGDPARTCALPDDRTPTPGPATAGPLVHGSLKAYPNPARRKPVQFAYTLTEPATVEFRILDASGHEVASFTRPGQRSDNLEVWDPGALPAGLYVASIRFSASDGSASERVPVGILR